MPMVALWYDRSRSRVDRPAVATPLLAAIAAAAAAAAAALLLSAAACLFLREDQRSQHQNAKAATWMPTRTNTRPSNWCHASWMF